MIDVTTWTAHATREPSAEFLASLDQRWRECTEDPAHECVWHSSRAHALALVHADRAAHRRRLRTQYIAHGTCALGRHDHGFSPMSDLIPHDQYGPELLDVIHTGKASPLAVALTTAKTDANLAVITVFTEQQFTSVDSYVDHAATHLQPEGHGAIVPFLHVKGDETDSDAEGRVDLLRANGYTNYTVDARNIDLDPSRTHRDLAAVMEDVFDQISQLKADAAASILTRDPLWPVVLLRT